MIINTRRVGLAISMVAAVGLAGLIYWWDPAPPAPADGLIHQHPPRMRARNLMPAASPALPHARAVPEPAPIAAASSAAPPPEAWLPPVLTAEEKSRRSAADAYLMKSEVLERGSGANAMMLEKEVINRRYADIDTQLNAILAKAVADPAWDLVERDATTFSEGGRDTPQLNLEAIDDWIAARPDSPWAHLSAAWRLDDKAWEVRGGNFADKISDEQWKAMHRYATQARTEVNKSLRLEPRSAMAWTLLIQLDQLDSGPAASDYRAAMQHRPGSIVIPDVYQGALEPRWGGSYEQMQAAARSLLKGPNMNPRFWSIGGFAAADEAYGHMDDSCDECTPIDWTSKLKNYNAALVYGDHTDWLADAAQAALHLHRYALAYRYYERANAYVPEERGWPEEMRVLRMLCDSNFPRQEFEAYEQDAITYGFISAIEHPRVVGDCNYRQGELPWGDEPIPTAASVETYYLDPDANPPTRVERSDSSFSEKPNTLKSEDGRYLIVNTVAATPDANGNQYKLQVKNTVSGVGKDFYAYATSVMASWTVNAKRIYVSDNRKTSDTDACSVFNMDDLSKPILVFKELARQVPDFQSLVADKDNHLMLRCYLWLTNDHLILGVTGWHTDTKLPPFSKSYEYDVTKNSFTTWSPGAH